MHDHEVADVFSNQYSSYVLNKKRLMISENEPLFIFVTGHGGDYYFKMR